MTAGSVAIVGSLGRNIASGMTGGELFVISEGAWQERLGPTDLRFRAIEEEEPAASVLRGLLERHHRATGSERVAALLADWATTLATVRYCAPMRSETMLAPSADLRVSSP
jgi:glutamate synthase (NADPH/NADH) large chain